jgi:hypothetical protein
VTVEKLQSCITWTKKSWEAFKATCFKFVVAVVAFITRVKTRFTSVSPFLFGIVNSVSVFNLLLPLSPNLALCYSP